MNLFYSPDLKNERYELPEEESRHCIRVNRLKKGDHVHLTDGRGGLFKAVIEDDHPTKCRLKIVERWDEYGKKPFRLHLGIAPTKNVRRFEWFVEKSTELGVDEIHPLHCFHSERKQLKTDRLRRIAIAAMKQSLRTYLPVIHELTPFPDFLHQPFNTGYRYLGYCDSRASKELQDLYLPGSDVTILVGPEGDFSEQEVKQAYDSGFQPVCFGRNRLRTETAGIVACHTIYLLNRW